MMKNTGRDPIMTAEVEVPERTDDQMYLEYLGSYAKLLLNILASPAYDNGTKLLWIKPFLKDLKGMATTDGDEALFEILTLRRVQDYMEVRTNNGTN